MGSYVTISTLTSRVGSTLYGQLLGVTGGDATTLGNAIIDRAEGRVNGYLAAKYVVPVTGNGMVEELTMCLAEYELYKRGDWPEVPPKIKDSYNEAVKELQLIAKGDLALPITDAVASDAGGYPEIEGDESEYTADKMAGY